MERLTYNFPFNGKSCWHVVGTSVETCAETCARMGREGCDICPICKAIDRLAEYENAEETGLLVRFPCKVGDTLWTVKWLGNKRTVTQVVISEMWFDDNMCLIVKSRNCRSGQIGQAYFLTREEARAALEKE